MSGLLVAMALGPTSPSAQEVVIRPPAALTKSPITPKSTLVAGNRVYTVYVADGASSTCGAWTARTGPNHEAGPGLNVLYGDGTPDTSDTTLRSYTSGVMYRTSNSGGGCRRMCDMAAPVVERILNGSTATGFRLTWQFTDGSGGPLIEFIQEVNVEGPVDGSETTDNTTIRETHVVRNLGGGTLRFGLRKHWDWQIANDDGPYFGDCASPTHACDRSMDMYSDGSGSGMPPASYIINSDPVETTCPAGVPPHASGCSGHPPYIVAGTVSPPSSLTPPPDAPELLEFNSWPQLVSTCWQPILQDAALCGAQGSPTDDTSIAYFYGLHSSSALTLLPGGERSFTEYVVAGKNQCPSNVQPPTIHCDAGGPYHAECTGDFVAVQLSGSSGTDQGTTTYAWTTDCPAGQIAPPDAQSPVLTTDLAGCQATCNVTLTVTTTDSSGQSSSDTCSATVTVSDTTPPALSCPQPGLFECSGGGMRTTDSAVSAWLRTATAQDACSGSGVPVTNDMPAYVPLTRCPTSVVVTFTAVDACGNSTTCTQLATVRDTTPPVVTAPAPRSVECGTGDPAADETAWLASATATDSCEGSEAVTHSLESTDTPCPQTQVKHYRFTSTDSCGNTGSATSTWEVRDTTPPTLAGLPADASAECDAIPGPAAVTATDACDPAPRVTLVQVRTSGSCPDAYTLTRTWTATDACGNSTSRTQAITVRDTTAPVLSPVPPAATVECDAVPAPAAVTATDNCDPAPRVTLAETRANGACPQSYTLTRTWTATDRCGNSASRSQVLTVRDTTAPVLSPTPPAATVECDAVPSPASVTATDNCDPSPRVTFAETRANGTCPQSYTLTRTWTATDACGNSASRTQVLTVRDTTAPVLSAVPPAATVECDAVPSPASVTATDNCDPAPRVTFAETRANGSCPQSYTLTRTWTATDACGNTASRSQVLTVRDTTAPTLSGMPANATVECDAVPAPAAVTASDNCDPAPRVTFAETRANASCPQSYTLTRTWTATDACGNSASRAQVLTVRDTTAPTLSGVPSNATVECDSVPGPPEVSASDNCDPAPGLSFLEARADGSCPQTYTLTRTWTATDACGNSASRSQVLHVRDTTAPALTVPAPLVVECTEPGGVSRSDPHIQAWLALAHATDNCAQDPPVTQDAPPFFPAGCPVPSVTIVTFRAVDDCGNAATRASTVTVVDTTPPVIDSVQLPGCLWPPNHRYLCLDDIPSHVQAHDACSATLDVRVESCHSNQPDNALGDGNTVNDCVVSPDGTAVCLRSERQGTERSDRVYGIVIAVSDHCGNTARATADVRVPHDQRSGDCAKVDNRLQLGPHDPFPWQR